eukprot:scaffold89873_cov33-Cyclotella_meneghiniana.AAC.1
MNKKMKTVLGKPSGKAAPSGQPKSPIKKDLLLPDPSSPTNGVRVSGECGELLIALEFGPDGLLGRGVSTVGEAT